MRKVLVLLLTAALCTGMLAGCGSASSDPGTESSGNDTETVSQEESKEDIAAAEEEDAYTEISMGDTIELPFVEITFTEVSIASDIRKTIKTGNISKTFGPDPESGYQFLILEGTIKNLDKKELPVYDFFAGEFSLDGYLYNCSANESWIYTESGDKENAVAPLSTDKFMIYAKIPDELSGAEEQSFRFGFYDLFDNQELAKNRGFEEDPISLCPYRYLVDLTGKGISGKNSEESSQGDKGQKAENTNIGKVQNISLGEKISLPFVEVTFSEFGIKQDITKSITTGIVTKVFGPDPENGYEFAYLEGTIKNLNNKELPVYDFFLGEFSIDGYIYECSAVQTYIYTTTGDKISMVEPLASYDFIMYAKVPKELADSKDNSFRFGFYDDFDNQELAKNRGFEEDPISLCPYQYKVEINTAKGQKSGKDSDDGKKDEADQIDQANVIKIDPSKQRQYISDTIDKIEYELQEGKVLFTVYINQAVCDNLERKYELCELTVRSRSNNDQFSNTIDSATIKKNGDERSAILSMNIEDLVDTADNYYYAISAEASRNASWVLALFGAENLDIDLSSVPKKDWKFSEVFFNTDENDLETQQTTFAAGPYVLWSHIIIEDGPLSEEYIQLKYEQTFPDGLILSGICSYTDGTDKYSVGYDVGRSFYYYWDDGSIADLHRGTYTVVFYNLYTGEYVGGKSVTVQ